MLASNYNATTKLVTIHKYSKSDNQFAVVLRSRDSHLITSDDQIAVSHCNRSTPSSFARSLRVS